MSKELNDEQKAALKEVIEYFWDSELESANDYYAENGYIQGHIFESLVTLDNFVNNRNVEPEEYLEEIEED